MNRKLLLCYTTILGAATVSAITLYARDPRLTSTELFAVLLLSVLAIIAELLAFVLPNSARGSIAFIPYLACALVVPSWATVMAVATVKAAVETVRKSKISSILFNVSLHALTAFGAIAV